MKKGLDCRLFLVIIFGVRDSRGDDDPTLTTAVYRDETSPKPTTIFRRINVDPHVQETSRLPLDLFSFRAHELRRTHSNVWNWDFWCQLQSKTGNGTKKLNRYYYDTQIDQCLTFIYSGSNGNKNKFDTVGDCERYCKGAAYMSIKATSRSSFCSLQPHAGQCMAMFHKYYYDLNEARCKIFMYGGCGGNQNRFGSLHECMGRCHPEHDDIVDPY